MQAGSDRRGLLSQLLPKIHALLLFVIGAALCWLGGPLIAVGGSPYYLVTGIALIVSALLLWRGDRRGALLYGLLLLGTYVWAFWEVGLDGWALLPRLLLLTLLGAWLLTPWAYPKTVARSHRPRGTVARAAMILLAFGTGAYALCRLAGASPSHAVPAEPIETSATDDGDWPVWGHDQGGKRFSPLTQINAGNVGELELAWSFRTGFKYSDRPASFEVTPLKIGDSLYLCTQSNDVIALDADTGRVRWRFHARSDESRVGSTVCRGVAYYRDPAGHGPCAERIITATIDARLLAVDAASGKLCPGFGKNGAVDLRTGLGFVDKGYYLVTSAPQIVRGKIVLGGYVADNHQVDEPSGVIRAYDASTGAFAWAFDVGRPDDHREPPAGQSYTRGTPNSWAPMSADETLGLVYVPTGNPTPDWYGGLRRPFDDKYSSSVVAIDAESGAVRWSFQTTHHDLWDYDVASQPTLYDFPVGNRRIPALIQPTKRGEIFVLDRRTGKPLTPVEERPVPRSDIPGERAAPTQPFSVGMPSFAGPSLSETMMWGLTPIDQAWCRLEFRRSNYQGTMTPPALGKPTITYPGYLGGSDWGGVSIDTSRDILVGNSSRVAIRVTLIQRKEADARGVRPLSPKHLRIIDRIWAQAGTPYAIQILPFLSPLDVPCQQPPYGMLSAIDLKTRKLLWEQPLGSARDSGPLGIPSQLPFTMGVPNNAGSVVTRGGLTFISATQDRYLRAFETRSGRLLWQARLPAGGQATPMTYMSRGGRQFVVIAAGGNFSLRTKIGDYVLAYALPAPGSAPRM